MVIRGLWGDFKEVTVHYTDNRTRDPRRYSPHSTLQKNMRAIYHISQNMKWKDSTNEAQSIKEGVKRPRTKEPDLKP
jgi:hypothetical protein